MNRRLWSRSIVKIAPIPVFGGALSSIVLISIALVTLIFSGISPGIFNGLRTSASDLLAPALSSVSAPVQGASDFIRDVSGLANMQAENIRLMEENQKLRDWYQTAMSLEAENGSLRELLNVTIPPQHTYITSRIIADSGNAYVKSLLISAGYKDGIKKGQAVLSGDGVIGRIVQVGKKSARVLLLTDINSRVPILIESGNQKAILSGMNDALPELLHLPPDGEVVDGARIVTSGHGGLLPPGLPIGQAIVADDGVVFADLYANMERLIYVRVVNAQQQFGPQNNGAL